MAFGVDCVTFAGFIVVTFRTIFKDVKLLAAKRPALVWRDPQRRAAAWQCIYFLIEKFTPRII